MKDQQFRLTLSTLAIQASDGGRRTPVRLPKGATVQVVGKAVDNRLVDVLWEGRIVKMFPQDIKERGEKV